MKRIIDRRWRANSAKAPLAIFTILLIGLLIGGSGEIGSGAQNERPLRYYDYPGYGSRNSEFVTSGGAWPVAALTYGFQTPTTPDLAPAVGQAAIAAGFAPWAAVTPLTFTETADCGLPFDAPACTSPDIRIEFAAGTHSDGFLDAFDGPGGTLAHAYFPAASTAGGDTHFDEDELWASGGGDFDLATVALHEFGHALGLDHTTADHCPDANGSAIMCPFYTGPDTTLHPDDIAGIQALYGTTGGPAPNTNILTGPRSRTRSRSATFTFSGTPAGATFECSLDGTGFSPCTSPSSFTGLSRGGHTFSVRANSAGAIDLTPASQTWRIKKRR